MEILIGVVIGLVPGGLAGAWLGIRHTARNLDRLLAVMPDEQVVQVARKARARKTLTGIG
jgi:hypothetical protein